MAERIELPAVGTVAEMIAAAGVDVPAWANAHLYIDDWYVPRDKWAVVRPKPGRMISLSIVPGDGGGGKNPLRTILQIAVLAAAVFIPPLLGPAFAAGTIGGALASAAIGVVGSLLINAIAPPPSPKFDRLSDQSDSPTYSITGGSNNFRPWGVVPLLCGEYRIFPPFAAQPYTEIEGDDQYWRAMFICGYGPIAIEDVKIGETPIGDFPDVELEIREGYPGDPPRELFTNDVFEEGLSIALTQAADWQQRATAQEADEISVDVTFPSGLAFIATTGTRQDRSVAIEVEYAAAGSGLWSVPITGRVFAASTAGPMGAPAEKQDDDGDSPRHRIDRVVMDRLSGALIVLRGQNRGSAASAVPPPVPPTAIPIAQVLRSSGTPTIAAGLITDERPVDAPFGSAGDFAPVPTAPESASIDIAAGTLFATGMATIARQTTTVRRGLRFPVPVRGLYDVRLRRTTPDSSSGQIVDKVFWTSLRSILNVDPIQFAAVATIALRIRATGSLSGVVEQLNCFGTSVCLDWTGSSWVEQPTNKPASLYRRAYQGPHLKRPRSDAQMDLVGLQEWADVNRQAGHEFNAYIDFRTTLRELSGDIAAAGRASRAMPDGKWGVVRDRPQTVPAQMFTPRNSWGFRATKAFVDPPHGLNVRFINKEIGYKRDERPVYADGFDELTATRLETLDLFGFTDPDLVWKEGRFHQAVFKLRPEVYELNVDFEHLVASRGDLVLVAHDVILVGLSQGRIKSVQVDGGGAATGVTLDELMTMELGKTYAFTVRPSAGDPVTRAINTVPGETKTVVFWTTIPAGVIKVGNLAAFGETDRATADMIIKEIRPGRDESAKLILVDAAPAVHDADQGLIPEFDSKVTLTAGTLMPAVSSIRSDGQVLLRDIDGGWTSRILVTLLRPSSLVSAEGVETEIRVFGSAGQSRRLAVVPIEAGEVSIEGVEDDETYELRLRYVLESGEQGAWTDYFEHTVEGVSAEPPDVQDLRLEGDTARWTYPDPPRDLRGYLVRHRPGVLRQWGGAEPAHEGTLTTTNFDISALPGGTRTIMVKAVDVGGNESAGPAAIFRGLGDPLVDNVTLTLDLAAAGFAGTVTDGVVFGNELRADDDGGLFMANADAPFLPNDGAGGRPNDLFLPTQYLAMIYAEEILPAAEAVPARGQIAVSGLSEGWTIEYRQPGGAAFLPDADLVFQPDGAAPFLPDTGLAFRPWPGELLMGREPFEIRVTTAAGNVPAKITGLDVVFDVHDRIERAEDLVLTPGGTRVPLSRPMRRIIGVRTTLQDDGGDAIAIRCLDKDPLRGPLLQGLDGLALPTGALVDAAVQGY